MQSRRAFLFTLSFCLALPFFSPRQTTATAQDQRCAEQQLVLSTNNSPSPTAQLLASATQAQHQLTQPAAEIYLVRPGDTLSRIAARYQTNVNSIMTANAIINPNVIVSGQRLTIPGAAMVQIAAAPLPAPFRAVWVDGSPTQGEAALVWVQAEPGITIQGQFGSQAIPFYPHCDLLWGLVAFDALTDDPGLHQLTLTAFHPTGEASATTVPIVLRAGNYITTRIINYPSDKRGLLDPGLIRAENDALNALFASRPPSLPAWQSAFQLPLTSIYITNLFGVRGSVNGAPPKSYHEGIDYRGRVGTPILSSAPGTVIVAEPLTVRGNTVYVDHGAGVVTGYFHMSEIVVRPGDVVNTGTVLGKVGATGLATGPHLHWEMRVNGRWVNPTPWLTRAFP